MHRHDGGPASASRTNDVSTTTLPLPPSPSSCHAPPSVAAKRNNGVAGASNATGPGSVVRMRRRPSHTAPPPAPWVWVRGDRHTEPSASPTTSVAASSALLLNRATARTSWTCGPRTAVVNRSCGVKHETRTMRALAPQDEDGGSTCGLPNARLAAPVPRLEKRRR